jgi:hypothetical protein
MLIGLACVSVPAARDAVLSLMQPFHTCHCPVDLIKCLLGMGSVELAGVAAYVLIVYYFIGHPACLKLYALWRRFKH